MFLEIAALRARAAEEGLGGFGVWGLAAGLGCPGSLELSWPMNEGQFKSSLLLSYKKEVCVVSEVFFGYSSIQEMHDQKMNLSASEKPY